MASKVKRNTINFNGKMVNIGVDMNKQSWRVTALVEGEVAFTGTLAKPNYDSFRKLLALFEGIAVLLPVLRRAIQRAHSRSGNKAATPLSRTAPGIKRKEKRGLSKNSLTIYMAELAFP